MSENNPISYVLAQAGWTSEEERRLNQLRSFAASIPSSGIRYEFKDYPNDSKDDFAALMAIYWSELLNRVHYASVISLLKASAWFEGIFSAIRDNNFHAFSASLRALIESVADSRHALLWVPQHLSGKRDIVSIALGRRANLQEYESFLDDHLETEMIHFSHAGKHKGRRVPDPKKHKAKRNRDYLDILGKDKGTATLIPIYEQLCEISHPAADSILPFVVVHDDHEKLSVYEVRNDLAIACLIGFSRQHAGVFQVLLRAALDPPFACLKELDAFPDYHAPGENFWCSKGSN